MKQIEFMECVAHKIYIFTFTEIADVISVY